MPQNPTLLADGFESAFIGWFQRCGSPVVAVYDRRLCIKVLMNRDGMSREDAEEYFEYNVAGAWSGEGTPAFLERGTIAELPLD